MIKTALIFLTVFCSFFLMIPVIRKMSEDQIKTAKYLATLAIHCVILTVTVLATVVFLF